MGYYSSFYISGDIAYTYIQKHKCPCCHNKLKVKKKSQAVDPYSPEADEFCKRFSTNSDDYNHLRRHKKFIWDEFVCPQCNHHFSIEQMMEHEGVTETNITPEYERARKIFKIIEILCTAVVICLICGIIILKYT